MDASPREQANILEKAGLATHIKSDRDTGKIIDGHPRHTDNQAQVATQTANTICKEGQPFVCDSTKVNAMYVFDSAHKWGDLRFTRPVKKGDEIYVKYGNVQVAPPHLRCFHHPACLRGQAHMAQEQAPCVPTTQVSTTSPATTRR